MSHQLKKEQRSINLKFPWGEKKGSFTLSHFKRGFAFEPHRPGWPFGTTEVASNDRWGQPGRLVRKSWRGRRPTAHDRIARCQSTLIIQLPEVVHILISIKSKRASESGLKAIQADLRRMKRSA